MTLLKACAIAVAACLAVFGVACVGVAGYVATGGIATVSVDTEETDLTIPVPTRLLDLGLRVAAVSMPTSDLAATRAELRDTLGPYRPVLEDLLSELDTLPDGDLVRVVTDDELVVVQQHGGTFRVEVIAPDTHVKVAVPRRAMSRLLRKTLALGEL